MLFSSASSQSEGSLVHQRYPALVVQRDRAVAAEAGVGLTQTRHHDLGTGLPVVAVVLQRDGVFLLIGAADTDGIDLGVLGVEGAGGVVGVTGNAIGQRYRTEHVLSRRHL